MLYREAKVKQDYDLLQNGLPSNLEVLAEPVRKASRPLIQSATRKESTFNHYGEREHEEE